MDTTRLVKRLLEDVKKMGMIAKVDGILVYCTFQGGNTSHVMDLTEPVSDFQHWSMGQFKSIYGEYDLYIRYIDLGLENKKTWFQHLPSGNST